MRLKKDVAKRRTSPAVPPPAAVLAPPAQPPAVAAPAGRAGPSGSMLRAHFEYGTAASRQPDLDVPDPPPPTYALGGHTYTFFAWADAGQCVPIYRCADEERP